MVALNGSKTMNYWYGDKCNEVSGNSATSLPLRINKDDKIKIFFDQLGRSVNLRFERNIPNNSSLPVMRFLPEETSFSSPSCYCIEPCPPSGLLDISSFKGKGINNRKAIKGGFIQGLLYRWTEHSAILF